MGLTQSARLCEEGHIEGIRKGKYIGKGVSLSKVYVIDALSFLRENGREFDSLDEEALVARLRKEGFVKDDTYNHQLHVLVALWKAKLLKSDPNMVFETEPALGSQFAEWGYKYPRFLRLLNGELFGFEDGWTWMTEHDNNRIFLPSLAGVGVVGFLQLVRGRLGTRSHRRSLPSAANCNPGSNNQAHASGDSHNLDSTISFEQGESSATLWLSKEKRYLATGGHANLVIVNHLPIE